MKVKKTETTETLPETKLDTKVLSWQQILLRATGLSILFTIIMLLITAVGVGWYAYGKVSPFFKETGLTIADVKQLTLDGIHKTPLETNGRTSFLILGIDSVKNKQGAPPLTDTMLLVTIDYENGKVNLLSLPRDLWNEDYKTKINALYFYGKDKYPDEPERFPREVISQITGVPINYTVVFSLESISSLVDILGGIDVDVPRGFTDTEFPREDVDVTKTKDPKKLYETVTFTPGVEHMTAERVEQYIRSRHSEGDTGTDVDRAARQQLILSSLMKKLMAKDTLTNPTLLAQLYNWYSQEMAQHLPVTDAIAIAHKLYPYKDTLALTPHSISITDADNQGVLEHLPPAKTDNQWTYSVVNPDAFKSEINQKLYESGYEAKN